MNQTFNHAINRTRASQEIADLNGHSAGPTRAHALVENHSNFCRMILSPLFPLDIGWAHR